jgi:rhomboid protease GluP
MFKRQTTGSVICASCGKLVGVKDQECWNCGRANPGLWGYSSALRRLGSDLGFVSLVLGGCSAIYVATLLVDIEGIRGSGLFSILSPSIYSLFFFGASGAAPVFGYGRWWTVLSAGWLHGSLIHILFNMYWVRQLAPLTAEAYGGSRMVVIYTVSSVAGFLLSSTMGRVFAGVPILQGAGFTVGASAAIFGLLGALVYYGRRGGSSQIGRQAAIYAIMFFVFGFFWRGVDNFAHLGGFLGGYGMSRWLDPLEPERIKHMGWALACIVLTALSILISLLQPVL